MTRMKANVSGNAPALPLASLELLYHPLIGHFNRSSAQTLLFFAAFVRRQLVKTIVTHKTMFPPTLVRN